MNSSAVEDQINVLKGLQLNNYFNVVSLAVLVYDYLITFSGEVQHIWGHSFSPITLVFSPDSVSSIRGQHPPLHEYLTLSSVRTYSILFKLQVWFVTIGTALAAVVLVLRTCAIYRNKRRIIICLSILYALIVIAAIYFIQNFLTSLQFARGHQTVGGSFFVASANKGIFVGYASLLAFETLVLFMTILKAKSQRNESRLYRTLYRDSLQFYIYIFAVSLCNLLLLAFAPGEAKLLLTQFLRVAYSIFLGRIILNIRDAMAVQNPSGRSMQTSDTDRTTSLLWGDSLAEIPVILDAYQMTSDEEGPGGIQE